MLDEGARFGAGAAAHPQRIQVEFVSGNPTGPVTVGSARNAAYGDSLARLFSFAGHEVEREYYFNDAGRQVDLFGASLRARGRGEEVPEDGYQGAYVAEIAAQLGLRPDAPEEQWTRAGSDVMMAQIRATLARFRVHFDSWFLERSLYEDGSVERAIERVRAGGHTYEQDGALWLRSSELGDDKDRVLVRSDGEPTYIAGDVAYIVDKLERGFDVAVYVLGADHHGYIGRLKAAAAALGYDPDRVDVQIYQLVQLTEGADVEAGRPRGDAGRPARRGRRGRRPLRAGAALARPGDRPRPRAAGAAERREPGLLLPVRPRPHRGHPAQRRRRRAGRAPDPTWLPEPAEAALVKALAEFPDLVAEAAERRGPHRIAGYTQETAKAFHQFYKQCRVIGEAPAVQASRLALCQATAQVMATSLDLVGVEAPESM